MTTTVGEVMCPGVVTCPPGASIAAMAASMVSHGIHALVVTPQPGHDPLVVTDLELVAGALQLGNPRALEIAREPMAIVTSDAPLSRAVEMMSVRSVSHLLVTDPEYKHPSGVLSTLDIAAVIAGVPARIARMLRPAPARPSASARDLDHASVSDVMHAGISACDAEAPITTAARIMVDHRTHCTAVTGVDATPGREQRLTWGLIDDMDLVGAMHRGALDQRAATIADTAPVAVREDDSLAHAAALMVEHERRHLVTVGRSGLPTGIVSTLDVAHVLANR